MDLCPNNHKIGMPALGTRWLHQQKQVACPPALFHSVYHSRTIGSEEERSLSIIKSTHLKSSIIFSSKLIGEGEDDVPVLINVDVLDAVNRKGFSPHATSMLLTRYYDIEVWGALHSNSRHGLPQGKPTHCEAQIANHDPIQDDQ